jgi:Tol biopolymer transport system component
VQLGKLRRVLGALAVGAALWALFTSLRPSADVRPLEGRLLTATGVAFGGLFAVNPDGTNGINLTANTFNNTVIADESDNRHKSKHPTASRDGSIIAFQSNRDGGRYRIFTVNRDATNLQQITFRPNTAIGDNHMDDEYPAISPDGSRIAFISRRGDKLRDSSNSNSWYGINDVFIVDRDGSNLRQVTETQINTGSGPSGSYIRAVAWGNDNTTLAFRGKRRVTAEDGRSYFQDVVGTLNIETGAETHLRVVQSPRVTSALDWSPDGTKLIYSSDTLDGNTYYIIPMQGDLALAEVPSFPTAITESEIIRPIKAQGTVRFSPDSSYIAFMRSAGNNAGGQLAIRALDGSYEYAFPHNFHSFEPIWWAAGPSIPTPANMTLTPNPLELAVRGRGQLTPELTDKNGTLIAQAAGNWIDKTISSVAPIIGNTGSLIGAKEPRENTICAENAGLTDCADVYSGIAAPKSNPDSSPIDDLTDNNTEASEHPSTDWELGAAETADSETAFPEGASPNTAQDNEAKPSEEADSALASGQVDEQLNPGAVSDKSGVDDTQNTSAPSQANEDLTQGLNSVILEELVIRPDNESDAQDRIAEETQPPPVRLVQIYNDTPSPLDELTSLPTLPTVTGGETLRIALPGAAGMPIKLSLSNQSLGIVSPKSNEAVVDIQLPTNLPPGAHTITVSSPAWTENVDLPVLVASSSRPMNGYYLAAIALLLFLAAYLIYKITRHVTDIPITQPAPTKTHEENYHHAGTSDA